MWSAATVLVCALDILGRSASTFPPINLIAERPPHVSPLAEAFTVTGVDAIFILTSSDTFRSIQRASIRCGNIAPVRKLASILIHEEAHVRSASSEYDAYEAQLSTLAMLGASPGSPLYTSVARARKAVLTAAAVDRGRP
jgi:hypothetical protein